MLNFTGRRAFRLILALALVAVFVPAMAVAQESAPGTPLTIVFSPVEEIEPGHEWGDAQGIFHLRGAVNREAVSGDIEGMATTAFGGDFMITGECNEEFCESLVYQWVEVDIVTDGGGWSGRTVLVFAEGEAAEPPAVRAILIGYGANAGKALLIDQVLDSSDDGSITFGGYLLEQAGPIGGVNLHYDLCFTGEGTAAGGFLMRAPFEDAGNIDASFTPVGAPEPSAIFGDMTFTSTRGELHALFVEYVVGANGHNIGAFVLLGGTGDYAGLYGFGRVVERVDFTGEDGCAGPSGYWLGESYGS